MVKYTGTVIDIEDELIKFILQHLGHDGVSFNKISSLF
jgi:hypothetical protein